MPLVGCGDRADTSHWPTLFERQAPPHALVLAATLGDLDASIAACRRPRGRFDAAVSRLAVEGATLAGHAEVVLALVSRLDAAWVRSNQPLRNAVFVNQVAVAKALVGFGMNPDCTELSSQSAREVATIRGDAAMLEALNG